MTITRDTSALILCHYYKRSENAGGPPQNVRDFLLPKVRYLAYIEHPFPYADERRSTLTLYKEGKFVRRITSPPIAGPEWIFYIVDVLISMYLVLRLNRKIDLCIALDPLNVISVLPFRLLGVVRKLIFYTIDYTPRRFPGRVLNAIYQWTDRTACRWADAIWVLSHNLTKERIANGIPAKQMAQTVLLPMGADLKRIRPLPISKIHRHQIIFVGILLEKQGLQHIIRALLSLIRRVKDVQLVVVGTGEYMKALIKLTKELSVEKHVKFLGFVERHTEVESLLCKSAIGVAPYVPTPDSYTYFTDPGKPKLYLACGLPVVITDVPAIARVIASRKAGFMVDSSVKSLEKSLITLLTNDVLYRRFRQNALSLAKRYDTNTLIANAIQRTGPYSRRSFASALL